MRAPCLFQGSRGVLTYVLGPLSPSTTLGEEGGSQSLDNSTLASPSAVRPGKGWSEPMVRRTCEGSTRRLRAPRLGVSSGAAASSASTTTAAVTGRRDPFRAAPFAVTSTSVPTSGAAALGLSAPSAILASLTPGAASVRASRGSGDPYRTVARGRDRGARTPVRRRRRPRRGGRGLRPGRRRRT